MAIINTYTSTPSDNYNLHFKGASCKFTLNNPKSFVMYTPNSNVIYTNNPLEYSFKVARINLWTNSTTFSSAGDISNMPDYSWYKENGIVDISGTLSSTDTTVTTHNFTEEELGVLPSLDNFKFQTKKQFSVGKIAMNIQPINSSSSGIAGYASPFSDVLVSYNGWESMASTDDTGFFTASTITAVQDGTEVKITSCVPSSFIYTTRTITTPFEGELSLMDMTSSVTFSLVPIPASPLVLPKLEPTVIQVADSRLTSTEWKLYASITEQMTSQNGFTISNAVIFKKLDDEIVALGETPTLVYTGSGNQGDVSKMHTITWSTEKGVLLNLENNALEVNEEYQTDMQWQVE